MIRLIDSLLIFRYWSCIHTFVYVHIMKYSLAVPLSRWIRLSLGYSFHWSLEVWILAWIKHLCVWPNRNLRLQLPDTSWPRLWLILIRISGNMYFIDPLFKYNDSTLNHTSTHLSLYDIHPRLWHLVRSFSKSSCIFFKGREITHSTLNWRLKMELNCIPILMSM